MRPSTDRALDESIALLSVSDRLPELGCRRAEFLGSGWAVDVYLLDDRYVARFPRNAYEATCVDFDESVITFIHSALSTAFAVPRVVCRGSAGVHFPYDFLVRELVPGVVLDASTPASDDLAADLGRALSLIHSVPVDEARAAGLREVDWDTGYSGPLHLVHADFCDGNIIVDPRSGRLSGVIDWGNAALGDPSLDFMKLVLWRGWDFARRVLDAYELSVDEVFLERIRSRVDHEQEAMALRDVAASGPR